MRGLLASALLVLVVSTGCPLGPLRFFSDDDAGSLADASLLVGEDAGQHVVWPFELSLTPLFPTDDAPGEVFPACQLASPLAHHDALGPVFIVTTGEHVVALDPQNGSRRHEVTLPAPDGEMAFAVSTPVIVDDTLFASYHTTVRTTAERDVLGERIRHLVVAIDLLTFQIDARFPVLELTGETPANDGVGVVPFRPENALGRSRLVVEGSATSGLLYVTFGNARDIQPWHGYAFEIDLALWMSGGSARSGFLVTTPEATCGPTGSSGSRDRRCGGGLWAPSGPLLLPDDEGSAVVLAPGNGQLDLTRGDYANTLMRVRTGLTFDPGCDASACAALDVDDPDPACLESCRDLFVPRMKAGEPYPKPADGRCDGRTMLECWALLDYIGGSTPARVVVDGHPLLVYPTKDGAAYLVDGVHFGTQHDRHQLVPICGTPTSTCTMDWAGMSVTEPVVVERSDGPRVFIATFMPDGEQVAGVVALRVVARAAGGFALERVFETPAFDTPQATTRFRRHPSRIAVQRFSDGAVVLWIVETRTNQKARLLGIDAESGRIMVERELAGRGYRFTLPVLIDDVIALPSCASDKGPSFLEAWRVERD